MISFISWWTSAVVFGTVIMFGALGEILTEKSGHLNLGVPGMMFLGGFAGFAGAFLYENSAANPNNIVVVLIALVCGFGAAALAGLLYSFFTVTLRANQNVTGLALTYLGVGIGSFGGQFIILKAGFTSYARATVASEAFGKNIAQAASLTDNFSQMFLSYGFLVYVAVILAICMSIYFKRSRVGLNLRAVGENPATADAAGINVTKYKYLATTIGGGICGLGGLFYVLVYCKGGWTTNNSIEALGWLAVALVIFTTWKPVNTIWGSYLFALLYWLYTNSNVFNTSFTIPQADIVQMLPYLVTILMLILIAFRKKKEYQPPAALGLSYFREER